MKLYDNSCPRVPSGIPLNEGLLYVETQTREMCVYSNSRWKTRLDFIVFSHHLKKDPKNSCVSIKKSTFLFVFLPLIILIYPLLTWHRLLN